MPKQFGLVTRNIARNLVEVQTERSGACGGCRPVQGCGTCLTNSKIRARVVNRIGAKPGDMVEIHMETRAIYISAAILYGLPLLGLLAGAISGAGIFDVWFGNETLPALSLGMIGMGLGLVLAVAIGNSRYARNHLTPTINRILNPVVPPHAVIPDGAAHPS